LGQVSQPGKQQVQEPVISAGRSLSSQDGPSSGLLPASEDLLQTWLGPQPVLGEHASAEARGGQEALPAQAQPGMPAPRMGTLWGLLVLSLAYLHHSTSGFALPALLPIISEDLHLSDTQGALLTAGYTVGGGGPGG
jgi:hypothetical protein